jgi:hypothetical protein
VDIFLSCAAASCYGDPSNSIHRSTHLHNGDLPKHIGHEYQVRIVRLQTTDAHHVINVIWEGTPRCCHAGERLAAELQASFGQASLLMQFPAVLEVLR